MLVHIMTFICILVQSENSSDLSDMQMLETYRKLYKIPKIKCISFYYHIIIHAPCPMAKDTDPLSQNCK